MHSRALLGRWGEEQAAKYWRERGAEILARNWQSRYGEIDLVVLDAGELVACEVKTRRTHSAGTPFESITTEKIRKISTVFALWRGVNQSVSSGRRWRIDAIGVTFNESRVEVSHLRRIGL